MHSSHNCSLKSHLQRIRCSSSVLDTPKLHAAAGPPAHAASPDAVLILAALPCACNALRTEHGQVAKGVEASEWRDRVLAPIPVKRGVAGNWPTNKHRWGFVVGA